MIEKYIDFTDLNTIMLFYLNINPFVITRVQEDDSEEERQLFGIQRPQEFEIEVLPKAEIVIKQKEIIDYPEHWSEKLKRRYGSYKNRGTKKGKGFSLSFELFEWLFQQKCAYCGSDEIITIDRVDSNIGYHEGNVVSCCLKCNSLKSFLPKDEFMKQAKKIAKHSHQFKMKL